MARRNNNDAIPRMGESSLMSPETGRTSESYTRSPYTLGQTTNSSVRSYASGTTTASSTGKHLINDLVWLENKIAESKASGSGGGGGGRGNNGRRADNNLSPRSDDTADGDAIRRDPNDDLRGSRNIADCSLSFGSDLPSPSSSESSSIHKTDSIDGGGMGAPAVLQSIVCRDVYAPPGKLQIVITSTKDGPCVHTVKRTSALEGHVHPGDLIVAVDDVDARTYSAEEVMKTLTSKAEFERKITVLHFEDRGR